MGDSKMADVTAPLDEHARAALPELADCHFGRCELVLPDFVHAIRHEPRTRTLIRWATVVGSICLPLGAWLLTTPQRVAGGVLFALGIAAFAAHNAPEHAAARWFQRTPREARSLRYTLNAQALIVVSDLAHQAHPWRSLHGFHEAPDALLLWVSDTSFLIVPKRAFAATDLPQIVARLQREVGAPPELPRFWAWLLAAAGLVVALVWLWNRLDPR
jgi:YcxB-like protein